MKIILRSLRGLFRPTEPVLEGLRPANPDLIAINTFLRRFAESERIDIDVSPVHMASSSAEYTDLAGIDYSIVRNRFRILSGLDPVVNREEQIGKFLFSYRMGDSMRDVVFESRFPSALGIFHLKKK